MKKTEKREAKETKKETKKETRKELEQEVRKGLEQKAKKGTGKKVEKEERKEARKEVEQEQKKEARKKEHRMPQKKGKNCVLALVLIIVILLGVIMQNKYISVYAQEEITVSEAGDGIDELKINETGIGGTEINETGINETEINETEINETVINGNEELEESISDNTISFKMLDEEKVVQEEIIKKDSISCNIMSLQKTGYIFDGYLYENVKVIDTAGYFTAEFLELLKIVQSGSELELKPIWIPKTYKVYYGKDEDQDGFPDGQFLVTYGESYEDISPRPDRGLSVFKGYYFGRKQVFSRKGKAKEKWLWDSDEDIILKAKYYRPEGNDLFGDNQNQANGESGSQTQADGESGSQASASGESNSQIQANGESGSSTQVSGEGNSQNSDTDSGNAQNQVSENSGSQTQMVDESTSQNQANADNKQFLVITDENILSQDYKGNSYLIDENNSQSQLNEEINATQAALSENTSLSTNNYIDEDGLANYNSADMNANSLNKAASQNHISKNAIHEDFVDENGDGIQNKTENTNRDNSVGNMSADNEQESPESKREETQENSNDIRNSAVLRFLWENYRKMRIHTEEFLEEKGISKEVLRISVYMVTVCIILAAMLFCFYLLQNSAILYTNNTQGKRKRIAYILLQKKQEGYILSISKKQLDESETGSYVLILSHYLVRSKRNDRLIISIPNKKWCELPAKEISFLA